MNMQKLVSLTLVFFLVFSFAGQSLAEEQVTTKVTEDGRVQIILEFDDAEKAKWASEYIGKMMAKKVLTGYPDGTFQPNKPVKRVEAIVTAVRLMGLEEEAKAKASLDTELHFKDAKQIDKKYAWAKGHIIVALENGLFDSSEDKIQPNKPASRVWVSSLLVRALGLQDEALQRMTTIPDFKDAKEIPAGAVGYINVALENDVITGYTDQTFKPNKPVTRAEMATLLVRTDEELLENAGAVTVRGTVTNINFGTTDTNVTDDVYADGTITIEDTYGDTSSYTISSNLIVQHGDRFIRADQIEENDIVTLVTQDGNVNEAYLLGKQGDLQSNLGIIELEVKAELGDDQEYKLEYKNKDGRVRAEIKSETKDSEEKISGEAARVQVEQFIENAALTPDMSKEDIVKQVLAGLQIEESGYEELKIEIKFANGKKTEIKRENEDLNNKGYLGVRTFELSLELQDNEKLKLKYKHEDGEAEAEIKKESSDSEENLTGTEAITKMQAILELMALTDEMTKEQVVTQILAGLNIDRAELKKLETEIEFTSEVETEVEIESEDDEEDED